MDGVLEKGGGMLVFHRLRCIDGMGMMVRDVWREGREWER